MSRRPYSRIEKSSPRSSKRRPRPGFSLEALENRLMLHHDPGHTLQSHVHSYLTVYINGVRQTIPAEVGFGGGLVAPVHTHDTTGKLHIEPDESTYQLPNAPRFPTVGDFFNDVWRLHRGNAAAHPNAVFSSTNILGNQNNATHQVRFYVNGSLNNEFENYILRDGDDLVISYESIIPGGNANNPTFVPLPDTRVKSGSPLLVSLDGFDTQGGQLTYSVQVTPTTGSPGLTGRILANQRYARIRVRNFGDMVFQLFDDMAPRVAGHIADVAASDNPERAGTQPFYNDVIFHRVIDGFVVQAGDSGPAAGEGGSSLGDFDDQFHVDLQHNRRGLLSMAKTSDDTNDSQFFIIDQPIDGLDNGSNDGYPRHLDFNHSIFGVIVEGQDILERISNVALTGSTPTTPVVIESFEVFNGLDNGVLLLKATGTSGEANVAVTVRDAQNNSFTRTFKVTVGDDTINGSPFLEDIVNRRVTAGSGPVQFNLTGRDVENTAINFQSSTPPAASGTAAISTATVTPTNTTAATTLTVTPSAGFVGVIPVTVIAYTNDALLTGTTLTNALAGQFDGQLDRQVLTLTVAPTAPTVDLAAASDSGFSNTDNVTNVLRPSITINGVTNGAVVKLFDGNTQIGQATATGTSVTITLTSDLSASVHNLSATQTVNSIESDRSAAVPVTIDTTAPGEITPAAPTTAQVGTPYSYNAGNAEEGQTGFRYSLVTPPTGMTIDATTGVITWTPTAGQSGPNSFSIVATDNAGNTRALPATVTVGTIGATGVVFLDIDGDGTIDAGDGGSNGWTVYLDTNNSGVRDGTEPSAVTGTDGRFNLANLNSLANGSYRLRIQPRQGFRPVSPNLLGTRVVTLAGGTVTGDQNFGVLPRTAPPLLNPQPDFELTDVNNNSATAGTGVSPRELLGFTTAWYFIHST